MTLYHGDCIEVMRGLPDNSIDAVVTDPPYGLLFMGKKWDYDVPEVEVWAEALRVLKPGGHLLAFAGTRTQHRMACRIEDAGFEIRDMIAWVYGSGFPKSLDVSKAIDKMAGALAVQSSGFNTAGGKENFDKQNKLFRSDYGYKYIPATEAAHEWDGWGTALKPALEPITLARKPLVGTVAANVLEYGTGGLNIDACRVGSDVRTYDIKGGENLNKLSRPQGADAHEAKGCGAYGCGAKQISIGTHTVSGRWPANLIHDGSDEVLAGFPDSKTGNINPYIRSTTPEVYGLGMAQKGKAVTTQHCGDSGSAARFFYCAKASKREREAGLDGMAARVSSCNLRQQGWLPPAENEYLVRNHHPTVKPIALMRYLCRLVTPPGGIVLDPFMGSGTTGIAARAEGFEFIGIERDAEYYALAEARINNTPHQLEIAT